MKDQVQKLTKTKKKDKLINKFKKRAYNLESRETSFKVSNFIIFYYRSEKFLIFYLKIILELPYGNKFL